MMAHYAVNLADMTRHTSDFVIMMLLRPRLGPVITVNKKVDGMAIELTCNAEQAQAIVDVVRMKIPKHKLRFYRRLSGRGGWKPV